MKIKLEHRIGVQAPAEVVWEVISDLGSWWRWNPLYPKADGMLRIDSRLTLEVALPGAAPRTITPTVLDWVPNEQIHWRLSSLGGLVKSVRYLEIEALTETGCIFSNGEIFDGFLGRRLPRRLQRQIRAGFVGMGEALKTRAEGAWRSDLQSPMSRP